VAGDLVHHHGERPQCAIADFHQIADFPQVEIIYDPHWRPLVTNVASGSLYWLAASRLIADLSSAFLLQANKYLEYACPVTSVPETWEGQREGDQLLLFTEWADSKIPSDPIGETALVEAADELVGIFKALSIPSLSCLAELSSAVEFVMERLSVAGDDQEAHDERGDQLLSTAGKLKAELRSHGLLQAMPVGGVFAQTEGTWDPMEHRLRMHTAIFTFGTWASPEFARRAMESVREVSQDG
jgi:hypothetical protein